MKIRARKLHSSGFNISMHFLEVPTDFFCFDDPSTVNSAKSS